MIKVFFSVLVLCTAAVVSVVLAIHFRVKRHLRQSAPATPELGPVATEAPALGLVRGGRDDGAQAPLVAENAAEGAAGERRRAKSS
ncbi:MAG TPA: hypothetical protein VKV05_12860 [Terriglobales bacterium]|nr:hypothetical protein [Terriglobales bacterium]